MKHLGTQTIKTERLMLRKFRLSDAQNMFETYCGKGKVAEFLSWSAHESLEDTKSYLLDFVLPAYYKKDTYRWAIVWKENKKVIGSIDVRASNETERCAELGWVLGDDYWGKGIMPEAAKKVLEYLFSVGYKRIQAMHHVANKKSARVMEKIGMQYEGVLEKYLLWKDNVLLDCCMWAITIM